MAIVQKLAANIVPTFRSKKILPSAGLAAPSHRWFMMSSAEPVGAPLPVIVDDVGGAQLVAVTSKPPTMAEDATDRWMSFDGVDDVVRMDYVRAQPFTVAVVARVRTAGTFTLLNMNGNGGSPAIFAAPTQAYLEAGAALAAVSPGADNAWHVFIATFNGASSRMTVDAVTNSGQGGAGTPNFLTLGQHSSTNRSPIDVKDLVMWPTAATAADHIAIRAALKRTHPGLP